MSEININKAGCFERLLATITGAGHVSTYFAVVVKSVFKDVTVLDVVINSLLCNALSDNFDSVIVIFYVVTF